MVGVDQDGSRPIQPAQVGASLQPSQGMATRSPLATSVTQGPRAVPIPTPSWPGINGSLGLTGQSPWAAWMSVWHSPAASTRTRTHLGVEPDRRCCDGAHQPRPLHSLQAAHSPCQREGWWTLKAPLDTRGLRTCMVCGVNGSTASARGGAAQPPGGSTPSPRRQASSRPRDHQPTPPGAWRALSPEPSAGGPMRSDTHGVTAGSAQCHASESFPGRAVITRRARGPPFPLWSRKSGVRTGRRWGHGPHRAACPVAGMDRAHRWRSGGGS
jgi:hypothetical protein